MYIYIHTFVKETVIQIPFLPQGNDEGDSYNENPGITFLSLPKIYTMPEEAGNLLRI